MSGNQRNDNEPSSRTVPAFSDSETTDAWNLVLLCRNDKGRFFPLLMKRHYALVVNMGYRFFSDRGLAEDMAQDVFLTVYHEIDRLQPGKQPFVHWLCRITSNSCRSLYRRRKIEQRAVAAGKVDYWYGDEATEPAERIDDETKDAIEYVNDALQLIKPDERMALILSHVAELKTAEIALMMKAPEYTVRRLLRRAEGKMHKLISQRTFGRHERP
ncbi:MAG: sigma-70 family RNA polymerase sigma factor [Chitinispirillaceae bacterium]|nr:sigma-70 family RNA polymerase sigma factor [Chitinispirillaceae bacterium]